MQCLALGLCRDRNASIHHRHLQAQSSRVDVSLLFHPQIWEDENSGHFTWLQATDVYKIWSQMDSHFFVKTKHNLSLLRSYLFNEQRQYN